MAYLDGYLSKEAASYGAKALQHQQYSPIMERRDLSKNEQSEVDRESNKLIPRIFKSEEDPLSVDMASPWASGAAGAAIGGTAGALLSSPLGLAPRTIGSENRRNLSLAAVLLTLAGATAGGVIGYKGRQAKNRTVQERMRRLPEGARRRDVFSDPAYQADLDRQNQLMQAGIIAGSLR
jgi:hypothetical protein